jgi:glycosyltransferase involved in cell wall biosynthesis
MLIGIDASRTVTNQRTGTEAYALFLIRALLSLTDGQSHRLRLYFNQAPPIDHFQDFAHVEHCILPFPRLWTQVRLALELQQRRPDVFFTPAHVIPFTYRGCSVATVHDLGYHYFPEAHTRRQRSYLRLSTQSNGRLSQRLIADSQKTKADLVRFYHIDPDKIDVIYPGIDPSLKQVTEPKAMESVRRRYAINGPYLLFIGTLQPRKNLVRLVQAYAASGLQHRLVLAGKVGWRSESILDEISGLSPIVRQRIIVPGFIENGDKATLISGASALLFPSLYEGFGFPLLEGQVCGTPVLAANSSSLPEIAGGAALLVDPRDVGALTGALLQIVQDRSLRRSLERKGLSNVKLFTWDKTASSVLETLERAVSCE